jgi:hypothetical protein
MNRIILVAVFLAGNVAAQDETSFHNLSDVRGPAATEAEREPPPCPTVPPTDKGLCDSDCVVDILEANIELDPGQHQLMLSKFLESVGRKNTTIRLGPNVVLDFSKLPAGVFPIQFGKCVTLTSIAAIQPTRPVAVAVPRGTVSTHSRAVGVVNFGELEVAPPERPTGEARSPSSLGPILKYQQHLPDEKTFLEIKCIAGYPPNDGVRISGLRIIGPNFGNQRAEEVGIRIIRCVDVEISNTEIAGWGGQAISVEDEAGPDQGASLNAPGGRIVRPDQIRIHHNFIHHNQHPRTPTDSHTAGYGVGVAPGAWAKISENVFDFNRHAIEASGDSGGYVAARNLVLKGGGDHGLGLSTHQFDVHGDDNCGPRLSNTKWNCGNAGHQFRYVENAFQYAQDNAIKIRGRPRIQAYIAENVFPHEGLEADVGDDAINLRTREHVVIGPGNVIEVDSYGRYGVCDFDADGVDDLFLPTGATWWFSSSGEFHWSYLRAAKEQLNELRLVYFDDDLACDVLAEKGGQWVISRGGRTPWEAVGAFGAPLSEVVFGRFDLGVIDRRPGATRRTTHAFRRMEDGQWRLTRLSAPAWIDAQSSSKPLNKLRFGDFTGDGVTDVLAVVEGRWQISEGAQRPWRPLHAQLGDAVENLLIANMDADDNIDDLLRVGRTGGKFVWWRSKNASESWQELKSYPIGILSPLPLVFVGRFAPGGGLLTIQQDRRGRFYRPAELPGGAPADWTSLFAY